MESLAAMGEQSANYDEMSMHQTILFADSLKLYSAAEYFELSYINDDQKHIVVETLKDYAIKAIINTADHLGSVNYKVADLLEEKLEQVSDAEIRVSCIEQVRVRTCKEYIDREGVAQQASIIHAPRYHKRYILPAGKTIKGGASVASLKWNGCKLDNEDEWNQLRSAVRATLGGAPESSFRKGHSCASSPALRPLSRLAGTFSLSFSFSLSGGNIPTPTTPTPNKDLDDRRSVSPHRFTLFRSGSLATPKSISSSSSSSSAPTTPKSVVQQWQQQQLQLQLQRHLSKPGKSASMRVHDHERGRKKEVQRYPSKSKRLLMALLTRRKSNKDEMLHTFLDEY
ncbi:hypothetical protein V2J09_009133 [Rumex salicifolius]